MKQFAESTNYFNIKVGETEVEGKGPVGIYLLTNGVGTGNNSKFKKDSKEKLKTPKREFHLLLAEEYWDQIVISQQYLMIQKG